jgi:hypothetical protein
VREAVANEQSGDKEHAGHEETVTEQRDQIKSEPAHPVAIAEMGVIEGRVVQHYQNVVKVRPRFSGTMRSANVTVCPPLSVFCSITAPPFINDLSQCCLGR